MKITLQFDDKKLMTVLSTMNREQAENFLQAMHEVDDAFEIIPLLKELIKER